MLFSPLFLLSLSLSLFFFFSSVWFSSVAQLCLTLVTPWTAAGQASLSITYSWSQPKPMSIESVMPSNHLILCCPLLLLPSIFPNIRIFSNESALHIRWPNYWSFSFIISPPNENPGLISFRMDWLDPIALCFFSPCKLYCWALFVIFPSWHSAHVQFFRLSTASYALIGWYHLWLSLFTKLISHTIFFIVLWL